MADIFGSLAPGSGWDDAEYLMRLGQITNVLPTSPFGVSTGLYPIGMVGGGGSPRKAKSKAPPPILGSLAPQRTDWNEIGRNKLRIPLEEMSATYENAGRMVPRQTLDPQTLQGSILTPAIGDRSITGKNLLSINGVPLENPVHLPGGANFMRGPQQVADQAAWASKKNVIGTINNRLEALGAKGDPVNLVYSPMAARSSDFTDFTAKALLAQMKTAKVPKKAKVAFDTAMKAKVPGFPGIDKVTDEWIKANPDGRKVMAQTMEQAEHQDAGFPDVPSTRFALTEPELLGLQSGMSGLTVARAAPSDRIIKKPKIPHSTYDTQLRGTYLGGFERPIPREVMFPEWTSLNRKDNSSLEDYTFGRQTVAQPANQQWLDGIMNYLMNSGKL